MNYNKLLREINVFAEKLQDEESRNIFNARFEYCIDRNLEVLEENLIKSAIKYGRSGSSFILRRFYRENTDKQGVPFIIFGAGGSGRSSIRTLQFLGIDVIACVDNNYEAIKDAEGFKVESPMRIRDFDDFVILIAVTDISAQISIYYQLKEMGISSDKIMLIREGSIWADYGKQYFDLDELPIVQEGEIFVDAGCYDGETAYNASVWAQGKLSKVYAFEPDRNSIDKCKKRLGQIGCEYELYNVATWSCKDRLMFDADDSFGYASKVNKFGKEFVNADSIDNILAGRPVTYIKLDVEGSELETLKGAVSSIKKYRPKLAVSLYHKPEDIINLPVFIESLGMDYKYYIRHYQTRWCETTLYAF